MRCKRCHDNAVISGFCETHFAAHFEKKLLSTTSKHRLFTDKDRIAVACSGGKDSTALLYVMSRNFRHVTALAIDEGIKGYRKKTLAFLKGFCRKHKIRLAIVNAKDELGQTLDSVYKKNRQGSACTACGSMRRQLLNSAANMLGATVIATGHNMDDEAQSVMMNIFRNSLKLSARLGPKSGQAKIDGFVQRVKPMYHISERESFAYCHIMEFGVPFSECPYTKDSYRNFVREQLNEYEAKHPGTKANIIKGFLKMLPKLKKAMQRGGQQYCSICGQPSAGDVCRVCMTHQ